jgi:hypothetical protein
MAYQNKLARLGSSSRQYRRKAGGNFPFISGKSSKDSKGNYFTDAPFDDPGMPDIGAVSKFRANAKQELDNSQGEFNRKVSSIEIMGGKVARTSKNAIRASKMKDGDTGFTAYFDKSEVKSITENIQNSIMGFSDGIMRESLLKAKTATANKVRNMGREFKSAYRPTTAAAGDVYHKIADSLDARPQEGRGFRFLSIPAGSFDDKDTNVPTGVKGSRGANLAEMTENGTSPFKNRGRILVGGTKRIQDALKTR